MEIKVNVNGTERAARRGASSAARARDPRGVRADRHPHRLRHHQLRCVHRPPGRTAGQVVHDVRRPGGRSRGHDRRGDAGRGRAASDPGGVQGASRPAMRVLHPGDDARRRRAARTEPQPQRRRCPLGDLREHLPVHRLHEHREGDPSRGRDDVQPSTTAAGTALRARRSQSTWRARPKRSAGSATASSAWRTTGSSAAPATTSTTSTSPGCCTWRSCGARTPTRTITSIDASRAQALPGVIAVVTGELMAQHNLAWMPTLSGDTQAVLATDKVRFQGQEVAAVIADDPYVARDALELIDVDYDPLDAVTTPQQALEDGAPLIRTDKEGQENNHVYSWETGDKEATDAAFSAGRRRRLARHVLPAEPPGAARDVRMRRGHQPRDRPGDDLHDLAGAAPHPDGVRAGGRLARRQDPDHVARHRWGLRQQGAGVPRLRRRHRGLAPARTSREMDRGSLREPHLDRIRPRLPHAG